MPCRHRPRQPRQDDRAAGRRFIPGGRDLLGLEDRLEKIGRLADVTRRVRRVDADVALQGQRALPSRGRSSPGPARRPGRHTRLPDRSSASASSLVSCLPARLLLQVHLRQPLEVVGDQAENRVGCAARLAGGIPAPSPPTACADAASLFSSASSDAARCRCAMNRYRNGASGVAGSFWRNCSANADSASGASAEPSHSSAIGAAVDEVDGTLGDALDLDERHDRALDRAALCVAGDALDVGGRALVERAEVRTTNQEPAQSIPHRLGSVCQVAGRQRVGARRRTRLDRAGP